MKLKYVIFDGAFPVVFSEAHKHDAFQRIGEPTSAGFFSFRLAETAPEHAVAVNYYEVAPYGESLSLGIKSDPVHDKIILERLLNTS